MGEGLALYLLLGNLAVVTVIPAWVLTRRRTEGLAGRGFTRYRLGIALLMSVVLALGSLPTYLGAAVQAGVDPAEHLAYNLTILWEPLFVYGWLLLRFRRAFGWLPGVLGAAAGVAAHHLGSVPPITLLVFFVTGVVFAAVMAAVRNLWVMFPLAAGVSSAIGTLQAEVDFTWALAATGLVILAVQAAILVLFGRHRRTGRAPALEVS